MGLGIGGELLGEHPRLYLLIDFHTREGGVKGDSEEQNLFQLSVFFLRKARLDFARSFLVRLVA